MGNTVIMSAAVDAPIYSSIGRSLSEMDHATSTTASGHAPVEVLVGTSALIEQDRSLCNKIANLVNGAYGYGRLSAADVRQRLASGDAGAYANRVLHVATREGKVVGVCSSTIQTPWTGKGCGHWGLLSVDVAAQGIGVASALVL